MNGDNERCVIFLHRLDFFEKINSDLIEKMRCIKHQLILEFGDYNMATMIYALDIIDEMIVSIITIDLKDLVEKNISCEKIFYIISFKHFVDTTNEHEIEQNFE